MIPAKQMSAIAENASKQIQKERQEKHNLWKEACCAFIDLDTLESILDSEVEIASHMGHTSLKISISGNPINDQVFVTVGRRSLEFYTKELINLGKSLNMRADVVMFGSSQERYLYEDIIWQCTLFILRFLQKYTQEGYSINSQDMTNRYYNSCWLSWNDNV